MSQEFDDILIINLQTYEYDLSESRTLVYTKESNIWAIEDDDDEQIQIIEQDSERISDLPSDLSEELFLQLKESLINI